jgi:TolB-like protein
MLSAARMAQMSRLLDEVLELDAEGRRRWLEALPAEYRDLEPALEQALFPQEGQITGAGAVATLPKLGAAGDKTEFGSGLQAGEQVGPYRLMRPLGAGGMAEVWLAQRADGAFKREVALKLPMLSRPRKGLASRFARERDILAGLEHPNIARLYDAGVSAEGLPYLAMEYVHGEPLTAWCDAQRLGVRERLKLFLQVLDAVQYAHGHQVIHRDIKPSNILVTEAGQVRLLDFGVAKLLAHDDEQTELTQLYGRALTPDYASPELVRGDPIDAVADVYSLGVVLYELLSGSRPYRLKAGASLALLEQAIADAQVQRPSTQLGQDAGSARGTTQQKLARRLRGDLDAIVLIALAKTASDRYSSAEALADDLQRYLYGEPVEARPDHLAYRFAKFVRRNKMGVMATVAAALLVAGIGYELIRPSGVAGVGAITTASPAQGSVTAAGDDKSIAVLPIVNIVAAMLVLTAAGFVLFRARFEARGNPQAAVASDAATRPAAPAVSDKSIAVLPFVNMSADKEQEYFSDGLTEELIDRLSRIRDLKVIARTSAFVFKGRNEDIRSIASKLGVANLLEGSVRKSGKALRITAQLIRAADGVHLWSKTYERTLSDVFLVQSEIAGTVAQALNVVLVEGGEPDQKQEARTEAYNLLLQGNYFLAHESKTSTEKSIELFKRAIDADPNYALAWAKLARANFRQAWMGWITPADGVPAARRAAQWALDIDPHLSLAHLVLGDILWAFDWNWIEARTEIERALESDPHATLAQAHLRLFTALVQGQPDELIDYLHKEVVRDPLDTASFWSLGWTLLEASRPEESAAAFRQLLDLNPVHAGGQASLAAALLFAGRTAEALDAVDKEIDENWKLVVLPSVYWALERRPESDAALLQLKEKYAAVSSWAIASNYAYRGDADAAFEWLDRAYRQHEAHLTWVKINPWLRSLHEEPRFAAFLLKMKLPA